MANNYGFFPFQHDPAGGGHYEGRPRGAAQEDAAAAERLQEGRGGAEGKERHGELQGEGEGHQEDHEIGMKLLVKRRP